MFDVRYLLTAYVVAAYLTSTTMVFPKLVVAESFAAPLRREFTPLRTLPCLSACHWLCLLLAFDMVLDTCPCSVQCVFGGPFLCRVRCFRLCDVPFSGPWHSSLLPWARGGCAVTPLTLAAALVQGGFPRLFPFRVPLAPAVSP